jgi:hypothetical protein
VSQTNPSEIDLTQGDTASGEPPTCSLDDSKIVTVTLPVAPGGITGAYSVFITGSASFSSSFPALARTTGVEILVDGVALSPRGYATSSAKGDFRNVTVSFVQGGLDGGSAHTVDLIGCADANDVSVPQDFGVLSIIATG